MRFYWLPLYCNQLVNLFDVHGYLEVRGPLLGVFYSPILVPGIKLGLVGSVFNLLVHLTSSGKFGAIARPLKQKGHLFNYPEDLTGHNICGTCPVQYFVSLWTLSP